MSEGNVGDKTSAENVPAGTGTQGEKGSDTPISKAEFLSLVESVKTLEERLKQSTKDVVTDRVTKETGAIREELSALSRVLKSHPEILKEGVKPEQILRDKAVDLLLADLSNTPEKPGAGSPQAPPQPTSPDGGKSVVAGIDEILKAHGLAGNEPEIEQYMRDSKGKALLLTLQGLDELAVKISQRKAGDAASILSLGEGRKPPAPDLLDNYAKEMLANRGDREACIVVKDKYRKLGLDVDHVTFR